MRKRTLLALESGKAKSAEERRALEPGTIFSCNKYNRSEIPMGEKSILIVVLWRKAVDPTCIMQTRYTYVHTYVYERRTFDGGIDVKLRRRREIGEEPGRFPSSIADMPCICTHRYTCIVYIYKHQHNLEKSLIRVQVVVIYMYICRYVRLRTQRDALEKVCAFYSIRVYRV